MSEKPQTQRKPIPAAAIVVSREGTMLVPIQAVDFYPIPHQGYRKPVEAKK